MSESNSPDRPVISVAISPKSNGNRQRLQRALSELAQQNSTIRISTESLDGPTIISGMGELHLESIRNRILHEYKIEVQVGQPQIIYFETIRKNSEAEG